MSTVVTVLIRQSPAVLQVGSKHGILRNVRLFYYLILCLLTAISDVTGARAMASVSRVLLPGA